MEDARASLHPSFEPAGETFGCASEARAGHAPIGVRIPLNAGLHAGGAIVLIVAAVVRRVGRSPSLRRALKDLHHGDDGQTLAAITQRISRETDSICARVERLAKMLVAAIRRSGAPALLVDGADNIDSASIRILARVGFRLRRAAVRLELRFAVHPFYAPSADARRLIVAATWRAAAGDGLYMIAGVRPHGESGAGWSRAAPRPLRLEEVQPRIAAALHLLAFDVAVVLCDRFVESAAEPDEAAEGLRILATIFCNAAEVGRAEVCLLRAAGLARSPLTLSRILYTHGLVAAKRRGEPEAARAMFETGQRLIWEHALDRGEAGRLCLAWHDNGLALLDAMAVRAATSAERAALFHSAASREREAFGRIAADVGAGALYLRYNLRANAVMLLEMASQPASAKLLFERSFAHFDRAAMDPRFRMTMQYRLGALAWKAGDWAAAATAFGAADAAARDADAQQARNPIRLAHAAAELRMGRRGLARHLIRRVIADARERRDRQSESRAEQLRTRLSKGSTSLASQVDLSFVPSKLPSYTPFIDLLDGGVGLNAKLTQ